VRNIEVGHVDGHEENHAPRNLFWTCRSCNVLTFIDRSEKAYREKLAGEKSGN
jgi:hypothetical protein